MKNRLAIVLFILVSTSVVHAFPTHTLHCRVGSEQTQQSMYIEMEDSNVESRIGTVTLSNWASADQALSQWVPFQKAQVKMRVQWNSQGMISGVRLNMGRTGNIAFSSPGNFDKYNSVQGTIRSSVMGFNYPAGIEADCIYFYATGPK